MAEYSHYSNSTLKAVITEFDSTNLFVQMFIYGYPANEVPASYVPFLPPRQNQRGGASLNNRTPPQQPPLTPMQTMQLLLMTGQRTTPPPSSDNHTYSDVPRAIRPEEMEMEQFGDYTGTNSALRQLNRGLGAWLGVLLLLLPQVLPH